MLQLTGKAKVSFPATRYDSDAIKSLEEKTFGRRLKPEEWAHLAGMPDDGEVSVRLSKGGNIQIEGSHPDHNGKAIRILFHGGDGKSVLHNAYTDWKPSAARNFHLRSTATQASQAQRLGLSHIEMPIADHKHWPKYGFDGDLSDDQKKSSEQKFGKPAKKVSDLLKQPGGSRWWNQNGRGYIGSFDLKPGSDSLKVLSEFLRRTGMHSSVPPVQKARDQSDDAILDEIWRSLAKPEDQPETKQPDKDGTWQTTINSPGHKLHGQKVTVVHSDPDYKRHTVYHKGDYYVVPSKCLDGGQQSTIKKDANELGETGSSFKTPSFSQGEARRSDHIASALGSFPDAKEVTPHQLASSVMPTSPTQAWHGYNGMYITPSGRIFNLGGGLHDTAASHVFDVMGNGPNYGPPSASRGELYDRDLRTKHGVVKAWTKPTNPGGVEFNVEAGQPFTPEQLQTIRNITQATKAHTSTGEFYYKLNRSLSQAERDPSGGEGVGYNQFLNSVSNNDYVQTPQGRGFHNVPTESIPDLSLLPETDWRNYSNWKNQLVINHFPEGRTNVNDPIAPAYYEISHPDSPAKATVREGTLYPEQGGQSYNTSITDFQGNPASIHGEGSFSNSINHDRPDLAEEDAKLALYHHLYGSPYGLRQNPFEPPKPAQNRDLILENKDGHGMYANMAWVMPGDKVSWGGPYGHQNTGTVIESSPPGSGTSIMVRDSRGRTIDVHRNNLHVHSVQRWLPSQGGPVGEHLPNAVQPPQDPSARTFVAYAPDGHLHYTHISGIRPGDRVLVSRSWRYNDIPWARDPHTGNNEDEGRVVGPTSESTRQWNLDHGIDPDSQVRVRLDRDTVDTIHNLDNLHVTHLANGTPTKAFGPDLKEGMQINLFGEPAQILKMPGGPDHAVLIQHANGRKEWTTGPELLRLAKNVKVGTGWSDEPIGRYVPSRFPGQITGASSHSGVWQHDFTPAKTYDEFWNRMRSIMPYTDLDPELERRFSMAQLNDMLARAEHIQNTYGLTRHPSRIDVLDNAARGKHHALGIHKNPTHALPNGVNVGSPIQIYPDYDYSQGGRDTTSSLGDVYAHELGHEVHEGFKDNQAKRKILDRIGGGRPKEDIYNHLGHYASDWDDNIENERPVHGLKTGGGHEYFAELFAKATRPGWMRGRNKYEDELHKVLHENGLFR